jgi:hypothetical protein
VLLLRARKTFFGVRHFPTGRLRHMQVGGKVVEASLFLALSRRPVDPDGCLLLGRAGMSRPARHFR